MAAGPHKTVLSVNTPAVDVKEDVGASEQTVNSTAVTQNSNVAKPSLIEKAKFGQQHGGTKHDNTSNDLSKIKNTSDKQDLDAIREMMNEALKGGTSAIEQLNVKVQELIEGKQKDTKMIEELKQKTEELSRLLQAERENNAKQKSSEIRQQLEAKNKEIEELQKITSELRQETEKLRTSLSKAAEVKMVAGNPSFADLSDKHRPEKLCEKFNNLYDNLWTDAFDHVSKGNQNERQTCGILLDIFKKCWLFCCKYADRQLEDLQDVLIHPEVPQNDRGRQKLAQTLSPKELQVVTDTRKIISVHSLSNISQHYFKNEAKVPENLKKYIMACLEICWYAAIHNPRINFSFDPKKNRDDFRGYTKSGKFVDYLVWPAMYLHADGPLLYKGVVQLQEAEREQM